MDGKCEGCGCDIGDGGAWETHYETRPTSVRVTAPAMRMAVLRVEAVADGGGVSTRVSVSPVIALETSVEYDCAIDVPAGVEPPAPGGSHEEFLNNEWSYIGERFVRGVQYLAEDGTVQLAAPCPGCPHPDATTVTHVVGCAWPTGEDAERLAPLTDQLLARVAEAAARRGRHAA